jgi:hypothetical protein
VHRDALISRKQGYQGNHHMVSQKIKKKIDSGKDLTINESILVKGLKQIRSGDTLVPVLLQTASNYAILSNTGTVTNIGTSYLIGNLGTSSINPGALTGFGLQKDITGTFTTSDLVTGRVYAADYAIPTPATLAVAASAMVAAYLDAAIRLNPDSLNLSGGTLNDEILVPGLYRWESDVTVNNDVTFDGGPNDVWIMQVTGTLNIATNSSMKLLSGAINKNIFWQIAGNIDLATHSHFEGNILGGDSGTIQFGSSINGCVLLQHDITLLGDVHINCENEDDNSMPGTITVIPSISSLPSVSTNLTVTTVPSASITPSLSADPSLSSVPTITVIPSISSLPSVSTNPTVTTVPSVIITPSLSANPSLSMSPSITGRPSISSVPTITVIPSISSSLPSVSTNPTVTTIPSVSMTPSLSANPSRSMSSSITGRPSISSVPTITVIPSISSLPSVSTNPTVTTIPSVECFDVKEEHIQPIPVPSEEVYFQAVSSGSTLKKTYAYINEDDSTNMSIIKIIDKNTSHQELGQLMGIQKRRSSKKQSRLAMYEIEYLYNNTHNMNTVRLVKRLSEGEAIPLHFGANRKQKESATTICSRAHQIMQEEITRADILTSGHTKSCKVEDHKPMISKESLCLHFPLFVDPTMERLCFAHAALKRFLPQGDCEPLHSVQVAKKYYDYFKPDNVKVILLAESHAYTDDENVSKNGPIIGYEKVPLCQYKGPREFVALVYCLAYGEESIIEKRSSEETITMSDPFKSQGTPQFWKLFAACAGEKRDKDGTYGRKILKSKTSVEERINNKLDIVKRLKERGIWLLDTSIVAWYIRQPTEYNITQKSKLVHKLEKARPPSNMKRDTLVLSWELYIKHEVQKAAKEGNLKLFVPIGNAVKDFITQERFVDAVTVNGREAGTCAIYNGMPAPNAWIPGRNGLDNVLEKLAMVVDDNISNANDSYQPLQMSI